MKYSKIAFKNLNRQKKRSMLLGSAIAFGIIAITLLNGFTDGLIENVEDNISMFFAGHIYLSGKEITETGKTISIIRDDEIITEQLIKAGINPEDISKRTSFTGTLIFAKNTVLQRVEGVNWQEEKKFVEQLYVVDGDIANIGNPNAIILTTPIAEKLGVQVGESLLVKMETITGQYNVGEFIVAAITVDPGILGSINSYANINYVNELVNIKENEYQTLSIYLEDTQETEITAEKVFTYLKERLQLFEKNSGSLMGSQSSIGGMHNAMSQMLSEDEEEILWEGTKYQLITINEMMKPLIEIVEILDIVGLVVLVILILITIIGIINTFRMVMLERIKEIGTIRALGMQKSGVIKLFMLEAIFLCIFGIIAGYIVSGIIMFIISLIQIEVSSPFYLFMKNGHPYFKIILDKLLFNSLIVFTLSLFAAVIPARKASKLKPVDALREKFV